MPFTIATHRCGPTARLHRSPAEQTPPAIHPGRAAAAAFTIVEVVCAIAILALFGLSAFYALVSFNDRAARNRNAEAARTILESNVSTLLAQTTAVPAATLPGTDLDDDGKPDGVLTTPGISIIVQRDAVATPVVTGDLYTLVTPVGTSVGLTTDSDLVMVQYMLVYVYHGKTFKSKLTTFKSSAQ